MTRRSATRTRADREPSDGTREAGGDHGSHGEAGQGRGGDASGPPDASAGGADGPVAPDRADEAAARLRRRATAIRDEHLEDAIDRLEARGGLSPAQRATVERLATRLTARLVGPTVDRLRDADDPETVRTALRVFDDRS